MGKVALMIGHLIKMPLAAKLLDEDVFGDALFSLFIAA